VLAKLAEAFRAIEIAMPQASPTIRSSALTALLEGLVDYAGLFPPTKLSMEAAVENYAAYANGKFSWMLGRFVVPAARLAEFEIALAGLSQTRAKWSLSALLGHDIEADIKQVLEFNRQHAPEIAISSVELKVVNPADIFRAHMLIPKTLGAFFEIPLSADLQGCVFALKECGRYAKIRTGGETPEMIPPSAGMAEFISQCAHAGVTFKATAGLHHPFRSVHRLTYAADSPSGTMHGFLNVFFAAALLRSGAIDAAEATELLNETSPEAFLIDSGSIGWREHSLTREQIAAARKNFSLSFGSCSFSEPVEDLQSLSLL
jgi:hypothetical protein